MLDNSPPLGIHRLDEVLKSPDTDVGRALSDIIWVSQNGFPASGSHEAPANQPLQRTTNSLVHLTLGAAWRHTGSSAQLANPDRRVEDVSGIDKDDIVGRVARTFFAYYGTYSVDLTAGTVTHHVQGSIRPSWIGTDQVRGVEMVDADHMKLSALTGGTASGATNFPGSNMLLWERAL